MIIRPLWWENSLIDLSKIFCHPLCSAGSTPKLKVTLGVRCCWSPSTKFLSQ